MKPLPRRLAPDRYLTLLVGLGEVGHALAQQLDLTPGHAGAPLARSRMDPKFAGRGYGQGAGAARFAAAVARAAELNRRVFDALDEPV